MDNSKRTTAVVGKRIQEADSNLTKKQMAFQRLQELREELSKYDFSESDREEALAEKYGAF